MSYTRFSDKEIEIIRESAEEVDEYFVEMRKGVAQTRYVMHVPDVDFLGNKPPKHLVGLWMMAYPCDLSYTALDQAISLYDWVRCKEVKVTTTAYERI